MSFIDEAINHVLKKIDQNLDCFGDLFPGAASKDQIYPVTENVCWTNSFWTGMLWLAYEVTGEEKYRLQAEKHVDSFKERLEKRVVVDHHDLGFLYSLSCVAAWKLTGNEKARETAIAAADYLIGRYHEKARIIQAWGDITSKDSKERGRMIIDCNMNLPLLYWASETTGDEKYRDIARNHIKQAAKYIVREDYSTHHTYFMDPDTGEPLRGETFQGYADDSCWARGQAWGIYGFLFSREYVDSPDLVDLSSKIADYFLSHLPKDRVCYWDLCFTEGPQERDSSSAAIAACGLLELDKYHRESKYREAAYEMMQTLYKDYTVAEESEHNGVLKHGVYHKKGGNGVNESCIWGDYFYFEALVRMKKEWNLYW